jgi:aspartate aminotransferase-like enzyme
LASNSINLRTPGPTPLPNPVLEALSNPMINHRGPEFKKLLDDTTHKMKQIFMTQNDVFILTASGTGALEASIVNTLSPGDKVISCSAGAFGDRYTEIARTYGANVVELSYEWGDPIPPEDITKALLENLDTKAVIVTHNETSTGVEHDLQEIARVVKENSDALILVDAVSSLGSVPLPVDGWSCDVVSTGSQKSFMIPPGLSFISFSKRAWEAFDVATMPKSYFDLGAAKDALSKGQTPWTPSISLYYALDVALDMMLNEGLENIFIRQSNIAEYTRKRSKELGLELLSTDEKRASNTVTAVKIPDCIDSSKFMSMMKNDENIVLAGGQGKLASKIFRIGHLGSVVIEEIEEVFESLERVLPKLGYSLPAK